ncbi:lytic transglycosylase domain-containing protein [Novosphingobium clariflavum]|uniref:Lytic transglycosylase domain-containing protein n=1 Tax=Novosphingobium clariflavum TaxID=2029884 RepID=A0ABV6S2A7_9SPHN|nr:lytic transglycosylase domain-containing protein [Novosphingobium clariflavum]
MSSGQVTGANGTGGVGATVTAGNPAKGSAVQAAIARAAQATGVDFNYLLAQARLESSLDPSARAATSSATGLFQFTDGTWLQTLGRHGGDHGMAWVQQAIAGGDPAMRAQVLGLRYDADASALMAAELASDNKAGLTAQLGREPDSTELYLAHFLGIGGAGQFLSALSRDPTRSAASVLPRAAAANPAIFYADGGARSLEGVMALMRGKVNGAMRQGEGEWEAIPSPGALAASASPRIGYEAVAAESSGVAMGGVATAGDSAGAATAGGPVARAFHARAAQPASAAGGSGASMADTLQSMFSASGVAAPANVRAAYARLAGLGL